MAECGFDVGVSSGEAHEFEDRGEPEGEAFACACERVFEFEADAVVVSTALGRCPVIDAERA